MKTTIVIPNYNGIQYLPDCLASLREELKENPAEVVLIDNGSTDESVFYIRDQFPEFELVTLKENTGFCKAVNLGIRKARTPYVILLNNDTIVKPGFVKALEGALDRKKRAFSVSACMLDMKEESLLDNAGDLYCALGWAFARGKGRKAEEFDRFAEVFSACGGAAIYRKSVFEEIGYFDENHFAYLEDVDIGWRAAICGYRNYYEPGAKVLHAGSGASGSRYNAFKVNLASANSVYMIGKNMPLPQIILNLPLLAAGFCIKYLFFLKKGFGALYFKGCIRGFQKCFGEEGREHRVPYKKEHFIHYFRIQLKLWKNIYRRVKNE